MMLDNNSGGQGGIRTHDTRKGTPHFECGAINRSTTCPREGSDNEPAPA